MIQIINKKDCVSCFSCANICPVNAISMQEDTEGFKYPFVDSKKCVSCGLCDNVCPVNSPICNKNSSSPEVYAYWSKNSHTRIDSTSALLIYILRTGRKYISARRMCLRSCIHRRLACRTYNI